MQTLRTQTPAHTHLANLRIAMERCGLMLHNRDGHDRLQLASDLRVLTHLGAGVLVSLTDDGWCEVQLDGETRVDEYPVELVELA